MKVRKKINEQLMQCIYALELLKKDSIERKENIIDCNIDIDYILRHAKEIVFICENMISVNKLKERYKNKD
tara:strand:+ start:4091 stop:4303 length:213 start_codon:yes stop_codon:yes gene_type:complete